MTATQWRWMLVLMLAETVSGFEASMIYASLSAWQRELQDPVLVGWIVSSYLLVGAAASALFGRLGDIFGRRKILALVIVIAGVGSVISAFGGSVEWVILGRGIQGAAGAIIPLCYGLVNELLPKDRVPFGVSLIVATAATASAIGLLVGGILTDWYGPSSIFVSSAVLAAIVAPVVAFGLPRSKRTSWPANFDWLGGALYAPGIAALLYAISEFGKPGSGLAVPVAFFAALVLLGWWYVHERRHPAPLMDVRQLASRNILLANLAMFATAVGVMQLTQVTSLLIQQPTATGTGLGQSATFMGLIKMPTVIIGILGSLAAGWLIPRRGYRLPILLGAALIAVPCAVIAFIQTDLATIVAVICLTSIGVNLAYAAIPTVIMASTTPDRISEATGLMAVFRTTGQALGAQTIAVLMATELVTLSDGRIYTAAPGYTLAFLFMAATGLVLAVIARLVRLKISPAASERVVERPAPAPGAA